MNERSQAGGNRTAKGKAGGGNAKQSKAIQNKGSQNKGSQNKGNQGKAGGKKRGKSRSRGGRSKKVDPVKYWGSLDALPAPSEHTTTTPNPSTLLASLGRPPVPGHENASKHYFSLVYERASNLAVALAAAGGLNDFALASTNGEDTGEPADSDGDGAERVATDGGPASGTPTAEAAGERALETEALAGSGEGPAD